MAVLRTLSQIMQQFIYVAQFHHSGVGNDESSGDIGHLFQILNGIVFEIDFRGNFEPLHIDSPFCNSLDVDQVVGGDVGSGGVLAVRAAAQGQRRHVGVVDIADTAVGRRRVHDNTAGRHCAAVTVSHFHIAGVDCSRVAHTADFQHGLRSGKTFFFAIDYDHTQNRGELFFGQRHIQPSMRNLSHNNLGVGVDVQTNLLGNPAGGLTHDSAVEGMILGGREAELAEFFCLFRSGEITVIGLQDGFKLIGNFSVHNGGLFRSADHAVVEALGQHDVVAGLFQVAGFVHISRHVAGAYAQSRFTGAVSSLDHARTTSGQD